MSMPSPEVVRSVSRAFHADDVASVRRLLEENPALKTKINEKSAAFDSPVILHVRSKEMLDLLLEAGADINVRSDWWAGGFGLLDWAPLDVAAYAITRGARVTVHSAARLGMLDRLKELVDESPARVHERGGDGQTPLHFAGTIPIADYLLERGAQIDALDIDHVSTPAQYMVKDRQDVARFLIARGCRADLLMAAALGDAVLAERLLNEASDCIRIRVSEEFFPLVGGPNGGTIYQWHLGWHVSACQVAKSFGHEELFQYLMNRCPPDELLLNACWLHDESLARSQIRKQPDLARYLTPAARRHVAHAARNNDTTALRLMLEAGFPGDVHSQHHGTALHWAGFHGNPEMVELVLGRIPIEDKDNQYSSTPLGWTIHGSLNGWYASTGDYPQCVERLLQAGAEPPKELGGTDAVKDVLRRHGVK